MTKCLMIAVGIALIGFSSAASAQEVWTAEAPAAAVTDRVTVSCRSNVFALSSDEARKTTFAVNETAMAGSDADTVIGFVSDPASALRTSFRCNESGEILGYFTRASERDDGGVLYEKLSFIVSQAQVRVIEHIEVNVEDFFYR